MVLLRTITSKVNNMEKTNGYTVYNGPSMIDGQPIVAILTIESSNPKTGNMAQLWIMPSTIAPHHAIKTGADVSVCGDCKHRRANGGACYVTVHQGPLSVWKAWNRGRYPAAMELLEMAKIGANLDIRLGAYGDPAALPRKVIEALTMWAHGWTGYSHQWQKPEFAWLKAYCMASADTAEEAAKARTMGWRYFRIRTTDQALGEREFMCPASDEGGNRTDCKTCQACNGASKGAQKASPVIIVHGAMAKRFERYAA